MIWNQTAFFLLLGSIVLGYLLGSVNFAIIVTRLSGKGDIRQYGSGNAGMTNVLRTVGKGAAVLTLLGDFCKGILAVAALRLLFGLILRVDAPVWCEFPVAYAALLGHVFPVFYGFRGGKGVLVSAGAILILSPWSLVICLAVFVAVVALSRYVSAGSIAAAIAYPFANLLVVWLQTGSPGWLAALLAIPMALFIIFLHRANIARLRAGTENKLSFKKK